MSRIHQDPRRAAMAAGLAALALAVGTLGSPAYAADQATEGGWRSSAQAFTQRLRGDERKFADAYSRMTWVHADVLAGDWARANYDLGHVKKEMDRLSKAKDLATPVRDRIAALIPMIDALDAQVKRHDAMAVKTAGTLVARFSTTAVDLAGLGWLGHAGGGAGGAPKPKKGTN